LTEVGKIVSVVW